jgi:hypothetical protein
MAGVGFQEQTKVGASEQVEDKLAKLRRGDISRAKLCSGNSRSDATRTDWRGTGHKFLLSYT